MAAKTATKKASVKKGNGEKAFVIVESPAKSKTIKKDSLSDFEIEQIQGCFEKETDKQYRGIDNKRFINNLINNANIHLNGIILYVIYCFLILILIYL